MYRRLFATWASHGLILITAFLLTVNLHGTQGSAAALLPDAADWCTLSWVDGPANIQGQSFDAEAATLALRSGRGALFFDPVSLRMKEVQAGGQSLPSSMRFEAVDVDGKVWRAQMRTTIRSHYAFPIRIIESGNWYQHLGIYDLELYQAGQSGIEPLKGAELLDGALDWRAWAEGGRFDWHFKNPKELQLVEVRVIWEVSGHTVLQAGGKLDQDRWTVAMEYCVDLDGRIAARKAFPEVSLKFPEGGARSTYNAKSGALEVTMATQFWPDGEGRDYPVSELDRVTRLPFEVYNASETEQVIPLRFIHEEHSVTGYVPLLLDGAGKPTGLSVQSSKNWHEKLGGKESLPYDGRWIHCSTRVRVPPKSSLKLEYAIVHSNWQGLPAASMGQLSLVGWGGNGFWIQAALGTWGENFCFQPGRVLRRSFITDVRPINTLGYVSGKTHSWTSNLGGGDVGLIIDSKGKYLPWVDAETVFVADGPRRTEARVEERLPDGAATLRTDVILPQTNDCLRTFLRIRMEVKKPLSFSRFALFQMGSESYSTTRAHTLAYGEGLHLKTLELKDAGQPGELHLSRELAGRNAWFSLIGALQEENKGTAHGERGLIVRAFEGRIGGRPLAKPWLSAYSIKDRAPNFNAELTVPPTVQSFEPGDYIEALLEFVILPMHAEEYFGKNEELRKAMSAKSRNWELIPEFAAGGGGLPEASYENALKGIRLKSGMGLNSLVVRGFPAVEEGVWEERINAKWEALGTRFSEEEGVQWTWNPQSGAWDCFLGIYPHVESDAFADRFFRYKIKTP